MERVKWVDVARGWGIIMVIYGHIANDMLTTWIYTFHVPLFFFLSGLFFNPVKRFRVFFCSKVKSILLPYLTLGIPLFIINLYYGFNFFYLLKIFILQQRATTLWFLAALFMQFVIAYFIYNITSRSIIRWSFVVILATIGIVLWHNDITSLPWNTDVSLVMLPFFCLGYYMHDNIRFQKKLCSPIILKYIVILMILNIFGTLVMYNLPFPTVDLFESHFSFEPIAYITAIMGILATCLISAKFFSKYIAYIGRNSMVYFVWQQDIAIMFIYNFLERFHLLDSNAGIWLYVKYVVVLVCSLILLTILNEVLIRTKLKVLIGKK